MELQISSDGGSTWSDPRALCPMRPRSSTTRRSWSTLSTARPCTRPSCSARRRASTSPVGRLRGDLEADARGAARARDRQGHPGRARGRRLPRLQRRAEDLRVCFARRRETWGTHKVVANTNSTFGWSLPAGGRDRLEGQRVLPGGPATSRTASPRARSTSSSRNRPTGGDLDDLPRRRIRGAATVTAAGGPTGAQLTLAVDARDRVYVLYNASDTKYAKSGCGSGARLTGEPPGLRA